MSEAPPSVTDAGAIRIARENVTGTAVSSVRTFGRAVDLGIESVRGAFADLIGLRFQWQEMLRQAWYLVTVTALPAVLMAVPFGVVVSVQVGNLIHQLGADSMIGAAGGLGVIQQGAPIATGLLLGGAGASAIAADLGARTVREEIDALRTMGISPVHRLVIPRVVAMLFVAPLLNVLIIFVGVVSGYAVAISAQNVTPGSYWATFGSFAVVADVWISLAKAMLFGFLVVIIACQRGLEARGGPRGVADGVNAAVVISVASIIVVNLVITQIVTMFLPLRVA
ncbi:phospholipid/cholesterol/gamma-HCH transport system permease protein [Nocardia amikacinitolerans]|uniref:Phospholipid/cholesterol/gamma-HCH transport system permease protein n=1 Tax=Nocardia amikacinitolerans TaxID=756689 RepID=A0A285KWS5_9NOCA|nr:ABC transporter permease [Nocardia amikacinitolerans]MCP2276081.1 phospholipid/cholesterol/gamma-HCH transport system permease protein [Nocardia amikacinitolerans]MCP2294352.1 phospholipid/cholesterol/gamma-HCH transport system permease protein [Nocardia amikacinitolerans]SNY77065.1 phospholipid/cholesterol/gamma-HCH transport system permease protein [Nocardia amikacinitolerans]